MRKIKKMPKFTKYGLIGTLAFAAEYSSFLLVVEVSPTHNLNIAQTISFCVGLLTSFLGSRLFTFKDEAKPYYLGRRAQFSGYVTLAVINLALTNVTIYVLIQHFSVLVWAAKIIVMISVVVWNYTILNRLIFKTH